MIDGRTQLIGLLGWPVGHSLSPAMHNAAFDALGMNWRYVALPVAPGAAAAAARGLVPLGFRGANVTVPHKEAVLHGLDRLSDNARALGAVNTLFIGRGDEGEPILVGHNTDHRGFIDALRGTGFDPRGTDAVVIGAGGAARAVVHALRHAGARRVTVLSRSPEQAERLVDHFGNNGIEAGALSDERLIAAARCSALLVNATPVGLWPEIDRSIWPDRVPFPPETFAVDLVYVPRKTKLLRQACRAGAPTLGGLSMLVAQGARAFELWTGREPPVEMMLRAAEAALRGAIRCDS
jgi:shikimate dehydrogenase